MTKWITRIKQDWKYFLIVLLGCGLLVAGWKLFWFLTDDAFIAFRYVSNSLLGHGYVWNPPPFQPVEGYTSFLWVLLLDILWRATGIDPPSSANFLSLVFSLLTLVLAARMATRLRWSPRFSVKTRTLLLGLFLLLLLSNRTFLAWTSSGLETALFGFLVLGWFYALIFTKSLRGKIVSGNFAAALLALTRPDGLLFVAGTALLSVILLIRNRARWRDWLGLGPLGLVAAHFGYRLSLYGEWLPNTYYAKVSGAWPQSGFWYLVSFLIEYGLWLVGILALFTLGYLLFRREPGSAGRRIGSKLGALWRGQVAAVIAVGTLGAHFLYYTFYVGGDFFEFRVYNHFLPLIFLFTLWAVNRLPLKAPPSLSVVILLLLLSLPVQWSHWHLARQQDMSVNRRAHHHVPVAPHWPSALRWYAGLFDRAQDWLIPRYVCRRYHSHLTFWQYLTARYPDREAGSAVLDDGFPVFRAKNVGIPGWVMPHVAVIDSLGLNDYVIARTPLPRPSVRRMAHDRYRLAPRGYIEAFRPNVRVIQRKISVHRRKGPLKASDIRKLETKWRENMRRLRRHLAAEDRSPRVHLPFSSPDSPWGELRITDRQIRDFHQYWYRTVTGKWKRVEMGVDTLFQLLSEDTLDRIFPPNRNHRLHSRIDHPDFEASLLKDRTGQLPRILTGNERSRSLCIFTLMDYYIDFAAPRIHHTLLYVTVDRGKVWAVEFIRD